jgi:hypothetical protein
MRIAFFLKKTKEDDRTKGKHRYHENKLNNKNQSSGLHNSTDHDDAVPLLRFLFSSAVLV